MSCLHGSAGSRVTSVEGNHLDMLQIVGEGKGRKVV